MWSELSLLPMVTHLFSNHVPLNCQKWEVKLFECCCKNNALNSIYYHRYLYRCLIEQCTKRVTYHSRIFRLYMRVNNDINWRKYISIRLCQYDFFESAQTFYIFSNASFRVKDVVISDKRCCYSQWKIIAIIFSHVGNIKAAEQM